METITLWLLFSLGYAQSTNQNSGRATHVVERFADQKECDRVAAILRSAARAAGAASDPLVCVQSTILHDTPHETPRSERR